jgi:Zn-dependent protease with chaperone function
MADPLSITNATALLQFANLQTSGYFWFGILMMLWIIILLAMLGFGVEKALMTSSFTMFVLAFLMFYAQLVGWRGVLFFISLFIGTILYIFITSYRENA